MASLQVSHTCQSTESNEYELESTGDTKNMPADILGGVVPTGEEPEDIFVKAETYKDDGSAFTDAGLKEAFSEYDITDDEATIKMVDSNIYRNMILPSEKAFAYKMKLEAIKHQGKKTSLVHNLCPS